VTTDTVDEYDDDGDDDNNNNEASVVKQLTVYNGKDFIIYFIGNICITWLIVYFVMMKVFYKRMKFCSRIAFMSGILALLLSYNVQQMLKD
jgi:hypothetical protein